jgi:peptidyl-prolyl cis-trans isomerase A (cyclophilin A)
MKEKTLRSIVQSAIMLLVVSTTAVSAGAQAGDGTNPEVVLETGLGRIVIEVFEDRAPKNAAYFLEFIAGGDYDGGSFYRSGLSVSTGAESSRIIQGGFLWNAATGEFSLEHDGARVKTLPAFDTTDNSGVTHGYGTVSLARDLFASGEGIPEFFICTGDSPVFDVNGRTEPDIRGFPAFGKVIEGMDVVEKIAAQPTDGISKAEAVKGQILTAPVAIEKAYRR